MKNKGLSLCLVLIAAMMIIVIQPVKAWGPNTHLNITDTAIATFDEPSIVLDIIQENWDACLVGLEYPDVGIFQYYTNHKDYSGLHKFNIVDEMLRIAESDRERAFAYCYKIHLAEDSISHNMYVPAGIRKSKLPDYIIHPIIELKIEGKYLDIRANKLMERHAEFDAFFARASGKDWSEEASKLNTIIGGGEFYSKAYNPVTETTWGKFQGYFYKFIYQFISEDVEVDYYNLAIKEVQSVLRGQTPVFDPAGDKALDSADANTQLWLYVGTALLVLVIFLISWRFKLIGFSRN